MGAIGGQIEMLEKQSHDKINRDSRANWGRVWDMVLWRLVL